MFKKNFLFILVMSILTRATLILGGMTLYKDTSQIFLNDGYIIETTTESNTKYYFSANTKYKENVEEKISFEDKENNKVTVDPASFIHYANGNIAFLQKGALVNLADITSPMVSYYNITDDNIIVYEKEHYVITSNNKKININSFIGRINDNKYIIAGSNLKLRIPTESSVIFGNYFEINYIEEGIVKIYNENHNYQVAAQDSYIYVGDNIIISLGDEKILYDNDAKMLLSQITINGNENINLDVPEYSGGGGGSGSGDGTGEGQNGEGDGTLEGDGTGEGTGDGTGEGTGEGTGDGNGNGTGGNGTGISDTSASLRIELTEAKVTSTTIDLKMQLNNAALAKGVVQAYLTNVATGEKSAAQTIELVNGNFNLNYYSLTPDTSYALTIIETNGERETQYFQKTFITKELGLTLEKTYATSDTLAYKLNFDINSEVDKAKIIIKDNNGNNEEIDPNEYIISAEDLNNNFTFSDLKSNTRYSINVESVWINNTEYANTYTINRVDTTLKETPKISGVKVDTNAEEIKFTISLSNVIDVDKSIVSYTYNVYLADDITLENLEPEVKYSITKTDSDSLILNLNEIDELKTGVDYRCKIIAHYNDNEMVREVSTDYSGNFLIRSKPNVTFELKSATMNKVEGTITLMDANCTVPIKGRSCSNKDNAFTLRYYELSEDETTENDRLIEFHNQKLTSDLSLTDLKSNTTYAVKVFGNYYDDDNILHSNVQLGDTFYVTTDKSENIYFEVIGDNISGINKDGTENLANVITFDAKLTAPQDSNIMEEISTVTLNLYNGRYNTKEKLIGTYKITDKSTIGDFFNNLTISNILFTDLTKNKLGKIDTLEKLITITANSTNTLNSAYTVEVENVYDSSGVNKITVENNVYTFNLTPSYYLDARIATNKGPYVTVTPITKEQLLKDEEEYNKLLKTVKNLDDLNNDTIIGLTIENSLSDIFVDSAYDYEKAIVNYTICNNTLNNCENLLSILTDNDLENDKDAKSKLKILSIDMGNKYQPKEQTIYLDSSEYTNAKKYFIRGYEYEVGFYISFTMEDGSNPSYTNKKLHESLSLERQAPIYTQYISKSTSQDITYRYSFRDVDSALADNNFYYTKGEDLENYYSVKDSLIADNTYKDVTLPINDRTNYTLYYARKNTKDEVDYVEITSNQFESSYSYDNSIAYSIVEEASNTLKIKLENTDATNRAIAYKVIIKSKDNSKETPYIRYFLSSKLDIIPEDSGYLDQEGNPIYIDYKYISIDYANISKFMGQTLDVTIYSYYDSGLIGYNQTFNNGFILKNNQTNKYLNIYNSGTNEVSSVAEDNDNMGIYLLKEKYNQDDEVISIYNQLINTKNYRPALGSAYYDTNNLGDKVGIKFKTLPTNAGMILTAASKDYIGYDVKVLNEAKLLTKNNTHKFDTIVPTINVTTNENTINSVKVNIQTSGIYGNKQFIKNNKAHNIFTVELYSDIECTNKLKTIDAKIEITGNDTDGYNASVKDTIEFTDLKPDTKYYVKIYAYVNNKLTQLYDTTASTGTTYIAKTYETKTLGALGIISKVKFHVKPTAYSDTGASSVKTITWNLDLKNTRNYKLRLELYKKVGTTSEINPETGEEVITNNYEAVKFNGSDANSCDTTTFGKSSEGYNSNCYISVPYTDISLINRTDQNYNFKTDDFVFGDGYYKLLIYAIPRTNNNYIEEEKVLLYQNDSLTTTTTTETINGVEPNIKIDALKEADFDLKNTLSAGFSSEKAGYYISFVPTVTDEDYVIKYGIYTVKLKNEKGEIVNSGSSCKYYLNNTLKTSNDGCVIAMKLPSANQKIKFINLTSNTGYYVELSYETYRNNVGFSEDKKDDTTPFTDFKYTPISNDITLGAITATQGGSTNVTLTYNGAENLSKIVKVKYTISQLKGSSIATGTYIVKEPTDSIFTIIGANGNPKLIINTSDENNNFSFKSGNTYLIRTQYYYIENGKETLLEDQITGNDTFTTFLNL